MHRKYLIVDDSPVIRMGLQQGLQRLKVPERNVAVAEDGDQGWTLFQEFRPNVVFMDLQMPGVTGDRAATKMLEADPTVRIILVTGQDTESETVRDLVSLGVFAVLPKPVRTEDLRSVLTEVEQEEDGAGRIR